MIIKFQVFYKGNYIGDEAYRGLHDSYESALIFAKKGGSRHWIKAIVVREYKNE